MRRRTFVAGSLGSVLLAGCANDPPPVRDVAAPSALPQLPPALANWDFGSTEPLRTTTNRANIPVLQQGAGSSVRFVTDTHFGRVASFNGVSDYLSVPAAQLGGLDFSRYGDEVTILAWVKRVTAGDGFVAGIWTEDEDRPGRQAAIFVNLPGYGGQDTVCGHVSDTGGPSPGLPYSRDFAASARRITPGKWRAVAMSLRGGSVTAYLDGLADPRPVYTEPGPPNGQSRTYSKNPYRWTKGLNHTTKGDFTAGATELTRGMWHFLKGQIAMITVFSKGLSQGEVLRWTMDTRPPSLPLFVFDGWRRSETSYATWGGSTSKVWSAQLFGWASVSGTGARDVSANRDTWSYVGPTRSFLVMPASAAAHFTYYDSIRSIRLSQVKKLAFVLNTASENESVRVCVKIAGSWWMRDTPFSRVSGGTTLSDGTVSQAREFVTSEAASVKWRPLTVAPNRSLVVGPPRSVSFPDGELQGLGFYTSSTGRAVRIAELALY